MNLSACILFVFYIKGYMEVNRLSSLKRDTDVFVTFEGDNMVILQVQITFQIIHEKFENL